MEHIKGYVEKIVYHNDENSYTVLNVTGAGLDVMCVGYFTDVSAGVYIEADGNYVLHKTYGEQFSVSSYQISQPENAAAMEVYLGSGVIKGLGKTMAKRIVKHFGDKTFDVIEKEPEKLAQIKGISDRKAREIAEQFEEKREFREAMVFLGQYGISNNLSMKIYKKYGSEMVKIVKENPYRLAEDIVGVGFKTADEIAAKMGYPMDSSSRYKAGIMYALNEASANGNTYLPYDELYSKAKFIMGISEEEFAGDIEGLQMDRRIKRINKNGEDRVYHITFYYMELDVARRLLDMNVKSRADKALMGKKVRQIEKKNGIQLEELQRKAVYEAVESGLLIITGGPGTGKTTTINTIIRLFEEENMEILLAAPTGRAAKRITETTGHEAQTIHRLLEIDGNPENEGPSKFEKNEENPLEADAVIIDEMSMVDIYLMYSLLKAIPAGTRVILVGDVNQLPSVGPGNVLKDIIRSECFDVVRLNKIFRQAVESDIITNAHKINAGQQIKLDNKSMDFFMLDRRDVTQIESVILSLIMYKLPGYVDSDRYDIQVLTPMRKGELGVENLNKVLQKYLNPASDDKNEKKWGDIVFREGDKVMQIKNDYQLDWTVYSKYGTEIQSGSGVFNGDIGFIRNINEFAGTITVEYEEGKRVEYEPGNFDELELAYAVTIHKSQGSEYPAVILPLLSGPRMLFNRNLLYTAVTRAKKCVAIVGSSEMVQKMIDNIDETKRYSGLSDAIMEMKEEEDVFV